MKKPTEDDIIEHVGEHGRYLPMGRSAFQVRYKGKLYYAQDTRDLVVKICNHLKIPVTDAKKKMVKKYIG